MSHERQSNLLGALVLSLHDRVHGAVARELDSQGESAAALVTLSNNPGQSVEWLRQALLLTHSGTVRLVDKLESEGFVERRRSASDARALELHVTPRGRRRVSAILQVRREVLDQALHALSAAERQSFTGFVERLLFAITQEQRGDAMCRLCEESACPQDRCPVTRACAACEAAR